MKLNVNTQSRGSMLAIALVMLAVISRWLPHPPNVAPIAAVALFSAVYLDKKLAVILPIASLMISDAVLGFYGKTMFFVYGSFLLTTLIGFVVKKQPSLKMVTAAAALSSVLFFLITNFGVWLVGDMYSKDLSGLVACYIAALPFFRNTLVGDLFYTLMLFGFYSLVNQNGKIMLSNLPKRRPMKKVNVARGAAAGVVLSLLVALPAQALVIEQSQEMRTSGNAKVEMTSGSGTAEANSEAWGKQTQRVEMNTTQVKYAPSYVAPRRAGKAYPKVTARRTDGSVRLNWDMRGGTCHVRYTESTARDYKYNTSASCDEGGITVGGLTPGVSYRFQVRQNDGAWTRAVTVKAW